MLSFYLAMLDDEGEKERFKQIYNKYSVMMGKVAMRIVKDEEAAFDAVENALVSIAKNIKSVPDGSDEVYERAYIQTIVRNYAVNELKKVKRKKRVISANLSFYSDDEGRPDKKTEEKDSLERLTSCITNMSDAYRDVLTMKYLFEMSVNEISRVLSLSENTVRTRIRRGTDMLKEAMPMEEK